MSVLKGEFVTFVELTAKLEEFGKFYEVRTEMSNISWMSSIVLRLEG